MQESKLGFEDSQAKKKSLSNNYKKYVAVMMNKAEILKNLIMFGGLKAEKLKGLLQGGDHENLKVLMISSKSRSSQLSCGHLECYVLCCFELLLHSSLKALAISSHPSPSSRLALQLHTLFHLKICDMVVNARYLNVTLIVPELDNTSFWNDHSQFPDIFDVDYFITSLTDEVQILKELPLQQEQKIESESLYSMPPVGWSNLTYYYEVILPRIKTYEVMHFTKSDARLANNGIPEEGQRLRCRVNYEALRFASPLQQLANKIVSILKQRGPFLSLNLRYEMDMIAFSGCNEGCDQQEIDELTKMRLQIFASLVCLSMVEREADRLREEKERRAVETALTLTALDIDPNIQVYITAGDIYKSEKRMTTLKQAFPNLVKRETLLEPSELEPFLNHSNQMAALDYYVSVESDIFVPTYGGNMAKLVEGHRRYLGFRKTIVPNRKVLVELIDQYRNGTLKWDQFSILVKAAHSNRVGNPTARSVVPGKPKEEDYFYTNPQECLPPLHQTHSN